MKVLFLCHRFPYPPQRGGKIRPFNIIRHLTARGCEVTVLSLVRSDQELAEAQGIAPFCSEFAPVRVRSWAAWLRMVGRLATHLPSSFGYFQSGELNRRVWRLLRTRNFDLVFVHCSSMAPYVMRYRGARKILDFGDMDSQKWLAYSQFKPQPLALGYKVEGIKLAAWERRLAASFDLCTCTTRAELETLQRLDTAPATGWFPNGVDSQYFAPVAEPFDPDLMAFVGRMDYYPNQQAVLKLCHEVLPLVRRQRPQVRLAIVGANPSSAIRELSRIANVVVTGSVADVRPHVQRAALTVANLEIARGTQNKILESMAMGVPVIASSRAAAGVDAVAGEHLLVGDTSAQLAAKILSVLDNRQLRDRLALAGRARILSHHSWAQSMLKLDELIDQAVSSRAVASPAHLAVG